MQGSSRHRTAPELRQIVVEASRALACLDAERLEELALCCQALNRNLPQRSELVRQARNAAPDMAIFARVLEATRSNLNVMRRLRDLRLGAARYGDTNPELWVPGGGDGNH